MATNRGLLARLLYEQLPSWWQQRQARKAERNRLAKLSLWEQMGYREPSIAELCSRYGIDAEQFGPGAAGDHALQTAAELGTFSPGLIGSVHSQRNQSLKAALETMKTNALLDCWTGKAPEAWKL